MIESSARILGSRSVLNQFLDPEEKMKEPPNRTNEKKYPKAVTTDR
jgi:hypothetical protein